MKTILSGFLIGVLLMTPFLSACSAPVVTPSTPPPAAAPSAVIQPTVTVPAIPQPLGAFQSGQYHNLFKELLNKNDTEIQAKIDAAWQQLFYGDDASQRVYYPVGGDMAYVKDIGNDDVRSEGMSYGMMLAVQLDKKEEFDRLWKWAKKYMYQSDGPYKGYFAWHCKSDGPQIDGNPASDGEEWFVMALLFAANRWGNGEGVFNYQAEAQSILDTMLHKGEENNGLATNMFDPKAKQVVFVPSGRSATFTDPSYHLPAYYELWARWAKQDNTFWKEAAQTSRVFFKQAANPATGLMPDYAEFTGQPNSDPDHASFRFDAFRVASNVAVDHAWFAADPWEVEQSNRLLEFFYKQGINSYPNQFTLDGKPLSGDRSTGLVAMNAVAALAATTGSRKDFVAALWNAAIPSGQWRYYDGLLYLLGLLHVSGNFKIYEPGAASASPRPTSTPNPIMKAKFVPPDGKTLLIVGQDLDTVDEYARTVGIDPSGVTTYTSLQNLEGISKRAEHGSGTVYMAGLVQNHPNSALDVGLDVVNSLKAINTGALDSNLDRLLDQLAGLKRPIFVRFGYEFDSSGNHYDPEQYKRAWIKFYNRMKEKQIDNIALVWQSTSSCSDTDGSQLIDAWYPGDAYVDWVGLSFFTQADCRFQPLEAVLTFAREHHKPVMIAESAPQRYATGELSYSTDGAKFMHMTSTQLWKEGYMPYFDFIRQNSDVVKIAAYLNTDRDAQSMGGPPYTNGYWGDSRVQANPVFLPGGKAKSVDRIGCKPRRTCLLN